MPKVAIGASLLTVVLAVAVQVRPFHDGSAHQNMKVELNEAHLDNWDLAPIKSIVKRKSQVSGWDGSHHGATRAIKSMLHDPSSYEHVDTKVLTVGNKNVVKVTYRAKNALGAKVLGTATYEVSSSGDGHGGRLTKVD